MRPPHGTGTRRAGVILLGALLLGGVATTTALRMHPGPGREQQLGPRLLTDQELNRFALMRFTNYREIGLHFHTTVPTAGGPRDLDGDVDFHRALGFAQIRGPASAFTLQWDATRLGAWPDPADRSRTAPRLPATAAAERALDPTASVLDSVLTLVLSMGQDRPDNAQLLGRSGARWLRSQTIGPVTYDVVAGPAAGGSLAGTLGSLQYWIGPDSSLGRIQATPVGTGTALAVEFDAAAYRDFPTAPALG